MVKNLFVNDLIEWTLDTNAHVVERIIWIDEGYIIAFVININAKKGLPEPKKISEILEAISEGIAFKL